MKKTLLTVLAGLTSITAQANGMGSLVCATRDADIIVKYSFFRSQADEYSTATVLLEEQGSNGKYVQLTDEFSSDTALSPIKIVLPTGEIFKVSPAKDLSKCKIEQIRK